MDDGGLETRRYEGTAGGWGSLTGIGQSRGPGDFDCCDAIFCFGQNPGPRYLAPLQDTLRRGCKIIIFNPVGGNGLDALVNPNEVLTGDATDRSHMDLQVRPSGDIAALMGLCKHVLRVDEQRLVDGQPGVIDRTFIARRTHDFGTFARAVRDTDWEDIEHMSGISRADLENAADVYIAADRTITVYGMGLTQPVHGSQSIGMLVNLMLLKGNIGRSGGGMPPARGHSNVQGQRMVGVFEESELEPLDKLTEMFDFDPPQQEGLTTVDARRGVLDGWVHAFVSLGGNFVRASPEP